MKVYCINDIGWGEYYNPEKQTPGPKYGDIDTVIETRTEGKITGYKLRRFPDSYFIHDQFIPLSEVSETEMERHYEKPSEIITYETLNAELNQHRLGHYTRRLQDELVKGNTPAVAFLRRELYNVKQQIKNS